VDTYWRQTIIVLEDITMTIKASHRFAVPLLFAMMLPGLGPQVYADFSFGPPVNTSDAYGIQCSSADGLELYVSWSWPGGGDQDIWVATRATTTDEWGDEVNLHPLVNSAYADVGPRLSSDGLRLYFSSDRPGGYGGMDLWVTTRTTRDAPWGAPVNLGAPVNTWADETSPSITADGLELYFSGWKTFRPGGYGGQDIWVATRPTTEDRWGEPVNVGSPVNTPNHDGKPLITADGLTMLFTGYGRLGGYGKGDIWMTRRVARDGEWGRLVNLGPTINTADYEDRASISGDGSTLYFVRQQTGTWQAPIVPVADFNGDGRVDGRDVLSMVNRWGQDEPLCDIGPTPLGDGIVDVGDLMVLAEYIGEEVHDPTLIAHWALDEIDGVIAYDSVGSADAMVLGGAVWQPGAGQVGGALAFDGIDDCALGTFVLNPVEGPFSVFAWLKAGGPGQVVVSQTNAANWLRANPADGTLMTEAGSGTAGGLLLSGGVITDGQWHRAGLVWDGNRRSLYVDDVLVAEDTPDGLKDSSGDVYIGCGKHMIPGTFWEGLIDDVRIYNRAVKP
jgi:hypothetical protein